jgi:hypothetical protein
MKATLTNVLSQFLRKLFENNLYSIRESKQFSSRNFHILLNNENFPQK